MAAKAKRKNVVTPWGPVHAIPGPNPEVVAFCADLLKRAKTGDIKGVAIAFVDGSNSSCSDWNAGHASGNTMIAAVAQLQFMMLKRKYEDD